jgi:mRNA interferase RelE/StbE
MTYELAFLDEALKEWRKLDNATREQFKVKLAERLQNPKVPSARLHGSRERYKIKLRNAGFRLVYQVKDMELLVLVDIMMILIQKHLEMLEETETILLHHLVVAVEVLVESVVEQVVHLVVLVA